MSDQTFNLLELDELGERAKNEPLPDLTDWDEITSNLILMLEGKLDYYYECYADDNSYSVTVGINIEGGLTLTYSPNTFEQELDFTYEYLHELVNDMKRYRKGRAKWILCKN